MRKIWYTAVDRGDGSMSVSFYESRECIEKLEEYNPESYRTDGPPSYFEVEGEVGGVTVETMADVDEYLEDMGYLEEDD